MTGYRLNARQTSLLRDIIAATRLPSDSPVPWVVLEQIKELLDADAVGLTSLDSTLPRVVFEQFIEPSGERELESETAAQARYNSFWHRYWDPDRGCGYPDRTGDYDWVNRDSDRRSLRQRRAAHTGDSSDFYERYLAACLPGQAPGRYTRLRAWRQRGKDFTDRDLFLVTLLKPHLELTLRRDVRSCAQPVLTKRQLQVMRMVQAGLTNRQIAKRTALSEGTEHAHLSAIYAKLDVQSRTAAVHAVFNTEAWPMDPVPTGQPLTD